MGHIGLISLIGLMMIITSAIKQKTIYNHV